MNWSDILVALIISIPPTIMAYLAWSQSKRTHIEFNSRVHELLDAVGREEYRRGVEDTIRKHEADDSL